MAKNTRQQSTPASVIEQLARAAGCTKQDGTVHAASFAEATGITAATISRVLHGRIHHLAPGTVAKLVRVFGISPSQAQGHEPLPDRLAVQAAPARDSNGTDSAAVLDELRAMRRELRVFLTHGEQNEIDAELLQAIAQLQDERAKRRVLRSVLAELETS